MVDALALSDSVQNTPVLMLTLRGDQDGDRLTDSLRGGKSKDELSAGVPGLDDTVQILADNCIIRGFDNGSEAIRLLGDFLVRPFAFESVEYPEWPRAITQRAVLRLIL